MTGPKSLETALLAQDLLKVEALEKVIREINPLLLDHRVHQTTDQKAHLKGKTIQNVDHHQEILVHPDPHDLLVVQDLVAKVVVKEEIGHLADLDLQEADPLIVLVRKVVQMLREDREV